MEEWKEYKIGDLFSHFKSGKGIKADEIYSSGKYPVFGGNGLRGYTYQNNFNGDCAIIGRQGAFCGNVRYFKGKAYMTEHAIVAVANENNNTRFLAYLLGLMKLGRFSGQSAQPGLSVTELTKQPIVVPSLSTQKRIASILSSLDDKIELNRRINENLEQQAQALFKSWFIDFEPFKDGKFVDSELGMIPEGWRVGTIGDYCKIRSGFAFKSSWWTERGVKIVKIKNISLSGILNMDDCSYVSKENVSKAKEFSLKSGDILIAMTGATIGKFCLVPALKEKIYVNQRVGKFFLGENPIMKIPFIHGLLKCENIISQIMNKGQGSAQPNISGNDIETIPIIYPPEDIILKYNELVSPYFSMIIENISACDFISQLRDTLLPRLMSGKLEIKDNSYD